MNFHPHRYYEYDTKKPVDKVYVDLYSVGDRAFDGVNIEATWDAEKERYTISQETWEADSYLARFSFKYWEQSILEHLEQCDVLCSPGCEEVVRGQYYVDGEQWI